MHLLHYQKAIDSFSKANSGFDQLYRSGGFAFSHYNIALCHQKLDQLPQAIQHFQKSVIALESAQGLNALGQAHCTLHKKNHESKDLIAAEKYYAQAIKQYPDYMVAVFNLGVLKLEQEKYQ